MMTSLLVEASLRRYGFPLWTKPYIVRYLEEGGKANIKHSVGFLKFGRKKGYITAKDVALPNGAVFKMDDIVHLLNLFYHGELRMSEVSGIWAKIGDGNRAHYSHFISMQQLEAQRARAIKNFVLGLGHKISEPTKELNAAFDFISGISGWEERLVTKKILLYNSYVNPVGEVFYRVFYPVSPEFLRPLAKVFTKKAQVEVEGNREAERIVKDGSISNERLAPLLEEVMTRVARSIVVEMPRAKKAGVGREAELLMQLAVAHPAYRLKELGSGINPEAEIRKIWKRV